LGILLQLGIFSAFSMAAVSSRAYEYIPLQFGFRVLVSLSGRAVADIPYTYEIFAVPILDCPIAAKLTYKTGQ
jgi:hypothetical protein